MSLHLEQSSKYAGEDWWEWAVWVEGSDEELSEIDHVMYVLHPTFPHPVQKIADRESKFRLETSGWGVFRIHAKVVMKDGRDVPLQHDLDLRYPDDTPVTA